MDDEYDYYHYLIELSPEEWKIYWSIEQYKPYEYL